MRDTFIGKLTELARSDPRICLLTGDLGFGVLEKFRDAVPDQYLNMGVAEQNMTGVAVGMALDGRVVFTYSIANFPTLRCLEQVRNDAAYHDASVKIVSIGGGFSYGQLGMSHHATEDLAIFRALPQVEVYAPGCLWEVEQLVPAIVERPGTALLRIDKSNAGRTQRDGERLEVGKMRRLREGDDAAIFAIGGILKVALDASDELRAKHGINASVFSVHTLKPFDTAAVLDACRRSSLVVTLEEHVVEGGLGGAVAEACMDAGVAPRAFRRVGIRGGFSSIVGSQDYLRARHKMDAISVVDTIHAILAKGS